MLSEPRAAELLASLSSLIRTGRVVALRTHGTSTSGTQFGVLKLVADREVRLGDLAAQLMVAPSVASRVVASLEADGLVCRHPDPADARASLIGPTEAGCRRLAERHRFSLAQLREVLDDWDDAEAAEAVAVMHRLEARVSEFVARLAEHPELVPAAPPAPPAPLPGSADPDQPVRNVQPAVQMEHQPA